MFSAKSGEGGFDSHTLPPVKKTMKRLLINVQKEFCEECSLALRRFIGKVPGVESIESERERIEIKFNDSIIKEEELLRLTKDSIEKLGYRINEDIP